MDANRAKQVRRLLPCAVLGIGLLGGLAPHAAHAEIDICRTDPVLSMSDGSRLTLKSTIQTNPANIHRVVYNVGIPAGLKWHVSFPGGSASVREVVKVVAVSPAGQYFAWTRVVSTRPASVTDTAALSGTTRTITASRSGMTGEKIFIRVAAR